MIQLLKSFSIGSLLVFISIVPIFLAGPVALLLFHIISGQGETEHLYAEDFVVPLVAIVILFFNLCILDRFIKLRNSDIFFASLVYASVIFLITKQDVYPSNILPPLVVFIFVGFFGKLVKSKVLGKS